MVVISTKLWVYPKHRSMPWLPYLLSSEYTPNTGQCHGCHIYSVLSIPQTPVNAMVAISTQFWVYPKHRSMPWLSYLLSSEYTPNTEKAVEWFISSEGSEKSLGLEPCRDLLQKKLNCLQQCSCFMNFCSSCITLQYTKFSQNTSK